MSNTMNEIDYDKPSIRVMEALRLGCSATHLPEFPYHDQLWACQIVASNPDVTEWLFMLRRSGIEVVSKGQETTDETWRWHLANQADYVILEYADATRSLTMTEARGDYAGEYTKWHERDNMTERVRQDIESAERNYQLRQLNTGNVNLTAVDVDIVMYSSGVCHVDFTCQVVTARGDAHTAYMRRHFANEDKSANLLTLTRFVQDNCGDTESSCRWHYDGGFETVTRASVNSWRLTMTLDELSKQLGLSFYIPTAI